MKQRVQTRPAPEKHKFHLVKEELPPIIPTILLRLLLTR